MWISNIRNFDGIHYFRVTMWQRIQTLYLAIATALVVTLFFCVKSFMLGPGGAHIDEVKLDRSLADLAISVPHESGVTLLTKVRT